MEVKPTRGLRVKIGATREAIFGEESVEIKKSAPISGENDLGVLTGRTLVGYCEVEMASLDGKVHWYPIEQMIAENGDELKEEEIPIPVEGSEGSDGEDEEDE